MWKTHNLNGKLKHTYLGNSSKIGEVHVPGYLVLPPISLVSTGRMVEVKPPVLVMELYWTWVDSALNAT